MGVSVGALIACACGPELDAETGESESGLTSVPAEVVQLTSGAGYTTVLLSGTYAAPVVVCSPESGSGRAPMVVRVRNAGAQSFEAAVQRPGGATTFVSGVTVHCLVVQAGAYTVATHGVKLEAKRYASTRTDAKGSYVGQLRTYVNSYNSPVVVGQVMTANDSRWSVFWARGATRTAPPSRTTLYTGKHVGEDTVLTRANETVGYVVLESGAATFGGVTYRAAVSPNLIDGFDEAGATLSIAAPPGVSGAVVSAAAFDGSDGGWPVLYGPSAATATSLSAAFDEDQIRDTERSHSAEQVAVVALASACACDDLDPCTVDSCLAGVCSHSPAPDGTPCADGDLCDGAETCRAGSCGDGTPLSCDDGQVCNGLETCEPATGNCLPGASAALGTSCDDADVCSAGEVCDGAGACVGIPACSAPRAEVVSFTSTSGFKPVALTKTFVRPVVVCTVRIDAGQAPRVTRVRAVTASGFEVAVARVDSVLGFLSGVSGSCLVVEEGVYTAAAHGVTLEARRFVSTVTDRKGSWVGEPRAYLNTYSSPVVVGQVMSSDATRWSSFWARGADATSAPSPSAFFAGKHVGEDTVTARVNELVGYLVLESGVSSVDGIAVVAGVSVAGVHGMDDAPPYAVPHLALPDPTGAVLSAAGLVGTDGGWPHLFGSGAVTDTELRTVFDEDNLGDTERAHVGSERIAYVVFGDSAACASDADGDRLADCVETATGVFVGATNTGTNPNDADTDGDGIQDGDEVLGSLSGVSLPAMGTNPLRQNILVEIDWLADSSECGVTHDHRPSAGAIDGAKAMFASAPVANPDGSTGIDLIVDFGQGGAFTGGTRIATDASIDGEPFTTGDYVTYKAAGFNFARAPWFHYVLAGHSLSVLPGAGGVAELPGDDLALATFCFGAEAEPVAAIFAHELGHNLFLRHGGNEDCNEKPNYNSIMNYRFSFTGVDRTCDASGDGIAVLDYSRGTNPPLDENALDERAGTCGGAIDWDGDGSIEPNVTTNVNAYAEEIFECGTTLRVLTDHDDWSALVLDRGSPSALELPPEIWP
ncbi:MAG: hypothetical protein HYV07_05355 [Deltaproteobacteria bacterium]|nr:hypothetical protein [Deltaproteobacteria bacterium]